MAETLREVAVKILFDADPSPINEVKAAFGSLSKAIGISTLTVGGLFAGMVKVIESTTEFADETDKAAKRLGLTTTELQQFQFALKQTGDVAEGDTVTGLTFFTRVLGDAATGSKSARAALVAAGVDFDKFGGQIPSTSQALFMVSERLKAIQNPAVRASMAADLFGKMGGAKLVGALSVGSKAIADLGVKAQESGAILDGDAFDAAEKMDKVLKTLKGSALGLTRVIGGELLKSLEPTILAFQEFLQENKGEIVKNVTALFKALGVYVRITAKFLYETAKAMNGLAKAFGGLENVLKIAAVLTSLFVGGKILMGIQASAVAVVGLVNAMNAAGLSATLLQAKIIGVQLAIGAAFLAIGLIIEDVYRFFSGDKSVLGLILGDNAQSVLQETQKVFFAIFEFVDMVIAKVSAIPDAFKAAFQTAQGFLGSIPGIGKFFSAGTQAATAGPSSLPVSPAGGGSATNSTANNNMNATLNIALGQGVPASTVAPEVQKGVEDAFQSMIRTSSKNVAGGVAY
jgi:hypothetical protein